MENLNFGFRLANNPKIGNGKVAQMLLAAHLNQKTSKREESLVRKKVKRVHWDLTFDHLDGSLFVWLPILPLRMPWIWRPLVWAFEMSSRWTCGIQNCRRVSIMDFYGSVLDSLSLVTCLTLSSGIVFGSGLSLSTARIWNSSFFEIISSF